jgi:hypothetical protein
MLTASEGSGRSILRVRWVFTVEPSGRNTWSFFLKTEFCNDTLDTSDTDGPTRLGQLLGNYLCRRVGIEETVSNHLPYDLARSTIVRLGATLFAHESTGTPLTIGVQQLKVTLLAITELLCGGGWPQILALSFIQHGELVGDFIVWQNNKHPLWTLKEHLFSFDSQHNLSSQSCCCLGEKDSRRSHLGQFKYDGYDLGLTAHSHYFGHYLDIFRQISHWGRHIILDFQCEEYFSIVPMSPISDASCAELVKSTAP